METSVGSSSATHRAPCPENSCKNRDNTMKQADVCHICLCLHKINMSTFVYMYLQKLTSYRHLCSWTSFHLPHLLKLLVKLCIWLKNQEINNFRIYVSPNGIDCKIIWSFWCVCFESCTKPANMRSKNRRFRVWDQKCTKNSCTPKKQKSTISEPMWAWVAQITKPLFWYYWAHADFV